MNDLGLFDKEGKYAKKAGLKSVKFTYKEYFFGGIANFVVRIA